MKWSQKWNMKKEIGSKLSMKEITSKKHIWILIETLFLMSIDSISFFHSIMPPWRASTQNHAKLGGLNLSSFLFYLNVNKGQKKNQEREKVTIR